MEAFQTDAQGDRLSFVVGPKLFCCEIRRQLAEQFATAARLYAEAVVLCTHEPLWMASGEHKRLRLSARRAQERAESARCAYEEHLDSHGCDEQATGGSSLRAATVE
jgi:hypothetical protein